MRKLRDSLFVALASIELLVLLAALAKPAYGYVDPGSGLLAFQIGGSMLAGGLFILRSKIRKLLRLSSPEAEKSSPETPQKAEAGD